MSQNDISHPIPKPSNKPFLLVPLLAATGYVLSVVANGKEPWILIIAGTIFGVILGAMAQGIAQRGIWKRHNYDWYRQSFPQLTATSGKLTCRHCGGTSLSVRNLMNQSWTRAHICNRCGQTLYYSPEA